MRHFKDNAPRLCTFSPEALPTEEEIDGIMAFDDRTLSSLIGRPADMLLGVFDGHDNDEPYRALPLERWRDR